MNYVGIDIHKRYSVLVAVDERGQELTRGRISGNSAFAFAQFFGALPGASKVVLEACWNWGRIYDVLSEIEEVEEVVLAHPLKTRLIAEAQIKTDSLDALSLATLLRGNLIASAHVPAKQTRLRKEELRQRLYWARLRTRIRNRVHALIDRQAELQMPQCSDLFGRKGLSALGKLKLTQPDAALLREDLELLQLIDRQIKAQEARIVEFNSADQSTLYLQSLPGMGKILAAVAAAEIDCIARFSSVAKLCAYAGLVPTTQASGGKTYQGHLLKSRNKWLQWAFIEAAWVAVGCSSYFGAIYRYHRGRGKKANVAITIVARRMCRIAFTLLKERRNFQEHNFPGRSVCRLTVVAA
jgi:transposase